MGCSEHHIGRNKRATTFMRLHVGGVIRKLKTHLSKSVASIHRSRTIDNLGHFLQNEHKVTVTCEQRILPNHPLHPIVSIPYNDSPWECRVPQRFVSPPPHNSLNGDAPKLSDKRKAALSQSLQASAIQYRQLYSSRCLDSKLHKHINTLWSKSERRIEVVYYTELFFARSFVGCDIL
jgi:hypothetical protein